MKYREKFATLNLKMQEGEVQSERESEDRDLTQKNMGEILNCSQRIYSNYECGDVDIPTHILIKLAEFHNTSVDYLLNLTDDKRPYPRKKNSST